VVHEVFKELTKASTLCISRAAQIVFKPLKCTCTGTVLETGAAPFLEKCEPALDVLSMKDRFHWSELQLLPCPPANCNNNSNQRYKPKLTNTITREPDPTINLLKKIHLIQT
jgi:hypothetical protein